MESSSFMKDAQTPLINGNENGEVAIQLTDLARKHTAPPAPAALSSAPHSGRSTLPSRASQANLIREHDQVSFSFQDIKCTVTVSSYNKWRARLTHFLGGRWTTEAIAGGSPMQMM